MRWCSSGIRELPCPIAGHVDPRVVGPVLALPLPAATRAARPALPLPRLCAAMGVRKVDGRRPCPDLAAAEALGPPPPSSPPTQEPTGGGAEGPHGRLTVPAQRGCRHRAHLRRQHQRHGEHDGASARSSHRPRATDGGVRSATTPSSEPEPWSSTAYASRRAA